MQRLKKVSPYDLPKNNYKVYYGIILILIQVYDILNAHHLFDHSKHWGRVYVNNVYP